MSEIEKSPKEIVTAIRERAAKSPVFSAMSHVFALRERTRQKITITTLYNTMIKEGFKFEKDKYAKELEFLDSVGVGKIDKDNKGRVRHLKDIKVTLQSIGMAALSKKDTLSKLKVAHDFLKLPVPLPETKTEAKAQPQVFMHKPKQAVYNMSVVVEIEGKQVTLVNTSMDAVGLLNFIVKLKEES